MEKPKKQLFREEKEAEEPIRINRYLADSGFCSRREADQLIEKGQVRIDGVICTLGSKVLSGQKVTVKEKEITRERKLILIAMNKPVGIVCTTDEREPDSVVAFLKLPHRIFPIGRLDKDSEGLLLLTNDGNIVNKILRAGNRHEKEYEVTVNKTVTPEFLSKMASGVEILNTVTAPCKVEAMGKSSFRITLTQGLNRQIRRMCEKLGYKVVSLKRVRIMHIKLGRLNTGTYRNLTEEELKQLAQVLRGSSNLPAVQTPKIRKQTTQTPRNQKQTGGAWNTR